ncbi:MAG: hypothetical protein QOG16_1431 [Actinomycetota bacterium]|jgi:hypothetical protein|nr:hypothetical protein [Actinomycetota bacterium]
MASEDGLTRGRKVLVALVILGCLAGGVGGIKTYLAQKSDTQALEERGVETDADVVSSNQLEGSETTKLTVSYDPPGEDFLEFAEVSDCPGARFEAGIETVRVVYVSDDPDTIRLQRCMSSFDVNVFPGYVGVGLIVIGVFMAWRLRKLW